MAWKICIVCEKDFEGFGSRNTCSDLCKAERKKTVALRNKSKTSAVRSNYKYRVKKFSKAELMFEFERLMIKFDVLEKLLGEMK